MTTTLEAQSPSVSSLTPQQVKEIVLATGKPVEAIWQIFQEKRAALESQRRFPPKAITEQANMLVAGILHRDISETAELYKYLKAKNTK